MSYISLQTDKLSHKWAQSQSSDLFRFWEIINNILEIVQNSARQLQ